jgi:branched-chain amino acid transport system substrate-binding protein
MNAMRPLRSLLLVALGALPAGAQSLPPVKVGFASAMSGPSAITGEGVRWAATMLQDEYNARGGVAGRRIEVHFADNEGTPGGAVSAVRRLADVARVDVIIGQTHSGACLGSLPIIEELQLPQVIESCSNPRIRDLIGKNGNAWAFRVNPDDQMLANAFATSIARAVKSIAIIAQNDDFGRGADAAYKAAFRKVGVTVTSSEFFDRGQADYRPLLTRVKRANPAALLLVMLASDGSVFIRQLRELGLPQKIFARGSLATVEFLHQIKDNPALGDGIIEATYWTAQIDPEWEKKWLDRWKVPVRVHGGMAAITFRHAVVPAIELAVKRFGRVDRQTIRDALEEIDVPNTPVGRIKFDETNQAFIEMLLIEVRGGQLRIVERVQTQP